MESLVLCNQSALIKGRSILDNFKYVQRSAVMLRKRKIPKLLLKLDISKAFDTVSWTFVLEVLAAWGFGQRWRGWISQLLSTASTRVLLNGSPGQPIEHRRGLRQGDPLSPMLFVLAMDLLNRLCVKAGDDGLLQPSGVSAIKHHCSLYADDVILFATPTRSEARVIDRILELFGDASGLRTNVTKCSITPIFGCEDDLDEFRSMMACPILQFPITYLGAPLSTRCLPKSQFRPLVEKVAARLPKWQGPLMNKSGRLTLVKSTLSTMPIYLTMSDKLPPWVIKQLDSIRRNFLWTGQDKAVRGKNVVAWPTVCRPTAYGGLGVIDLKLTGIALRTRWLWLQKTDASRSWSALQIQVEPEVRALFQASVTTRTMRGVAAQR
ncbi:unnamed protein product [Urochloa decumbens]|uniref:Reverse transcriptase domain-containing protein n=1 Tax=Urochloa decumbens TaxID=240449 RepID=A0ABC8YT02_9POAL